MISKNPTLLFIFGLIAWFFSMIPSLYAEKQYGTKIDWSQMIIYLPIFYGIANVAILLLLINLLQSYDLNILNNYYFAGLIMAFFYSGLGRITGHAKKYRLGSNFELHLYAILLYVIVYGVIFNFIDNNIC